MRRTHPLWRGFWLAAALTAMVTLLGSVDELSPWRLDRRGMVLFGAVTAGAFLGAAPGRIFRRTARQRTSWQGCAASFGAGIAMALGLGMAGSVPVLTGFMQGSAGALAFVGAAWTAGVLTLRLRGRRVRP